jgi:hypothetical protein
MYNAKNLYYVSNIYFAGIILKYHNNFVKLFFFSPNHLPARQNVARLYRQPDRVILAGERAGRAGRQGGRIYQPARGFGG